jgi:hypothetical protein
MAETVSMSNGPVLIPGFSLRWYRNVNIYKAAIINVNIWNNEPFKMSCRYSRIISYSRSVSIML